jgi:hypothetical protein
MVALLLVVLVGSAAVAFDLARLRHERHLIQAAVDLGSLAGAAYLPVADPPSAAISSAAARRVAEANAPQLVGSGLSISFACVVSDPQGNGGDDSGDLAFACGPAPGVTWSGGWTSRGGKALHACNPNAGDLCNTIQLQASSTIEYWFAPILGNDDGSTGAVRAAACKGYCGQGSSPLDVVFVIDRSRSMSDADVANVKSALSNTSAAKDSVLEFYNDEDVYIGLVALPYKNQSTCNVGTASTQTYPAHAPPNQGLWQVVPLSDNYQTGTGALSPSSMLVSRIGCLQRAGTITVRPNPGRGHTDYGDPLEAAQWILDNDPKARDDADDIIVFLGDGEANQPAGWQPCRYANDAATAAKAAGTTIFSLAYGAGEPSGGGTGEDPKCTSDTAAPFAGVFATTMFASIASDPQVGPPTGDNDPGGCASDENTDGDMYFCESRGADLEDVFRQIAIATLERTRLLNF